MFENELLNIEKVNTLTNPDLKRNIKKMITAAASGNKAVWTYARAVHDIITKESFKDDFATQKNFAEYVSLSSATISNYVNAVIFIDSESAQAAIPEIEKLTLGKAYMLSTLEPEQFSDFIQFCKDNDVVITDISDKALKTMLKELYSEKKEDSERDTDADTTDIDNESDTDDALNSKLKAHFAFNLTVGTLEFEVCGLHRTLNLDEEILEVMRGAIQYAN